MYKLLFFEEVYSDLDKLDQNTLITVREYFKKYEKNPYKYSQKLYNQGGLNLEGYRKTYIADAKYRIVIKIEENKIKIVQVVAVGERKDLRVYKEADKRLKS